MVGSMLSSVVTQITAHPAVLKWEKEVKTRMQEKMETRPQGASTPLQTGQMMSTESGNI